MRTVIRLALVGLFVLAAAAVFTMTNEALRRDLRAHAGFLYDQVWASGTARLEPSGIDPTEAILHDPSGIVVDAAGRIYFSERRRHVIRMIDGGSMTIVAGNGRDGFTGDGERARSLRLNYPEGLAQDLSGNLLVADSQNHRIRLISPDGAISTVVGQGLPGDSGDGGPAREAKLDRPMDVCTGPRGEIYIADWGNHRIRRVSPDGIITTVAGTGSAGYSGDGGPAHEASLDGPYGCGVGDVGVVYVADSGNHRVRKIAVDGTISTIAGTGQAGFSGAGGPAIEAQLDSPQSVLVGPLGEIVINDEHNHRIRTVLPSGIIVATAGNGRADFCGDGGPAVSSCLNDPEGISSDRIGNLFVSDGDNHRLRKIDEDGVISTIAGSGPIGKR